jgi:Ala-tRNA(Pro) deacylase
MTVLEKILDLLKNKDIPFTRIDHPPVYTSEEAAKIRGVSLSIGAKALVCFADKLPILIVIPGDKKVDFHKFKKVFGFKDLRMVSADEVYELTSLKIGSIPPFGGLMNLKSYFDNSFIQKDKSAFNAGSHEVSIIMDTKDLILLEHPQFDDIVM